MAGMLEAIRKWFRRTEEAVEREAEGGEPVATPPIGEPGDRDRETSTNAQMEGASDEPWPR